MRLITYNVNSLKARLPRLLSLLGEHRPDVVCLQETKASPETFPHDGLERAGYAAVDNSGGRWSGVAILARAGMAVEHVSRELHGAPNPEEARWIEAQVEGVRVASVYVPNGREIGSDSFFAKLRFFDAMALRAEELASGPACIAGDMNVCPTDIDVWDPALVHGGTHVTEDERRRLAAILDAGFIDAFRHVEATEPGFSWWDYRAGHFHRGFGLRIDLVLASTELACRLTGARVDREYRKPSKVAESKPSDHAPVIVDFSD